MVDLVKIRKKGKKKEEAAAQETSPSPASLPAGEGSTKTETPLAPVEAAGTQSKLDRFKEEAGRRRDLEFAAAEAEVATTEDQLELLTFRIAGEQYAVEIERIVEIVTPRPVTRIPNADAAIVGIISLRGTIVTVMDVRRRLRHPPSNEETADTRIVVVEYPGETLGFHVDHVSRVIKIDRDTVEPHPVVHASEQRDAIRGVFRHANALTILIDLDKLLDAQAPTHGTDV